MPSLGSLVACHRPCRLSSPSFLLFVVVIPAFRSSPPLFVVPDCHLLVLVLAGVGIDVCWCWLVLALMFVGVGVHWCWWHLLVLAFVGVGVVHCPGFPLSPYKQWLAGGVVALYDVTSTSSLLLSLTRNGACCDPVSRGSQWRHRARVGVVINKQESKIEERLVSEINDKKLTHSPNNSSSHFGSACHIIIGIGCCCRWLAGIGTSAASHQEGVGLGSDWVVSLSKGKKLKRIKCVSREEEINNKKDTWDPND
jgi:hypothetical protein